MDNNKIQFSDEVSDFIKSHNSINIFSKKLDKHVSLYWNECKYIPTENDNTFEVIFPKELYSEIINNRLDNE